MRTSPCYEDFAFFRLSAQRFFIISDMRFLAGALMVLRGRDEDFPFRTVFLRASPRELAFFSKVMAWLIRSLSSSSSPRILSRSKAKPPGRL